MSKKWVVGILLASSLVGCGIKESEEKKPINQIETDTDISNDDTSDISTKKWMYSNLVDESVQEEVKERLIRAGIPQEDVKLFIDWVNEYNGAVENIDLLQKDFALSEGVQITYDDVYLDLGEDVDMYTPSMDTNCRLTAALLMKDLIQVGDYHEEPDNYLMFDMESIDNDTKYEVIKEIRDKYVTLYNPVEVPENTDFDEHVKKIQEAWAQRQITFNEQTGASLVTLFLHDPYENKRFVGHAGVLIEDEEGLMLVEKYGSFSPYQVTKFNSEQEVAEYLLNRADIMGDGTEGAPIVMINDRVI